MKALCKIFKTFNASDESKSTFKVCLKWALPYNARRDPKFVGRPWCHDSRACLSLSCSVLFSFLTASNWSRGLNVLIVKTRLELVFNQREKRISAFDSSLGNAKDLWKTRWDQRLIYVKEFHKLADMCNNQTQTISAFKPTSVWYTC